MKYDKSISQTYQALGEFVIVFQWVEHLYRQIGWFILDPEHKQWPPMQLRQESNHDLLNKVTALYVDLTQQYELPLGEQKSKEMIVLKDQFHELRRYRNRVVHSTYVELKAGGETLGYIRANPEIGVDTDSGEN